MDGFFDMFGDGMFDLFSGHGIFDSLAEFGDFFGHGSGAAMEDILSSGRFRGAAAEAHGFEGVFRAATDTMWDYQIWRDMFGNKGSYQDFERAFAQGADAEITHIRDVLKGHGFMLNQLRTHHDHPHVGPLFAEYKALGTSLPGDDLLKHTHRKLLSLLNTDHDATRSTSLLQELNVARDAITDPAKRAAYNDMLRSHPEKISEWFTKISNGSFDEMMDKARRAAQLRLPSVEMPTQGFSKWLGDLPPAGKGGFIFATIAAVGIGVYALAKFADKKSTKHPPTSSTPHWQTSVAKQAETAATSQPSL